MSREAGANDTLPTPTPSVSAFLSQLGRGDPRPVKKMNFWQLVYKSLPEVMGECVIESKYSHSLIYYSLCAPRIHQAFVYWVCLTSGRVLLRRVATLASGDWAEGSAQVPPPALVPEVCF